MRECDETRHYYERRLAKHKNLGDKRGLPYTLGQLATLSWDEEDATHAILFYQQAIDLGEEIGDIAGQSTDLFIQALFYDSQGKSKHCGC
jgi:hypothetical protein